VWLDSTRYLWMKDALLYMYGWMGVFSSIKAVGTGTTLLLHAYLHDLRTIFTEQPTTRPNINQPCVVSVSVLVLV
jgi:hypothetical protein